MQRAVALDPLEPTAHSNLAMVLLETGRPERAEECCRRSIEINPNIADSHNVLGNALWRQGRLAEAEASYRRCLGIQAAHPEASSNLANVLWHLGALDDAEAWCRRAMEANPHLVEAYGTLGNVLWDRGQLEDAERCYRHYLEVKPDGIEIWLNLSNVLRDRQQYGEAEACCRRCLALKPDYAEAYVNLSDVLLRQCRLGDAADACRRALELDPGSARARSNLLFLLDAGSLLSARDRFLEALRFGEVVAGRARPFVEWGCSREPERPLRIGLVSGDLRNHPVGYFVERLLRELSKEEFSLNAYLAKRCDDALSARIRPLFEHWREVWNLSDEALARLIHDDEIDILIDLAGHTARNRLPVFAWKPAPVAVSWLGYSATTGVDAIDYYLTDSVRVPPAFESCYVESVWRLPDTRVCFSAPDTALPVMPAPASSNGYVTFGCFQSLFKLTDEVLRVWSRILALVPTARLRIQSESLSDHRVRARFNERLVRAGIEPGRVGLHSAESRERYFAAYGQVDLVLDTFPYPGGTTTCEALWMGVPTLTLAGESELSRNGASQMSAAGLAEWVARSEAEYVRKAVGFAGDPRRVSESRGGMRGKVGSSPLFDAHAFAGNFGDALREMWRRYCFASPRVT